MLGYNFYSSGCNQCSLSGPDFQLVLLVLFVLDFRGYLLLELNEISSRFLLPPKVSLLPIGVTDDSLQ